MRRRVCHFFSVSHFIRSSHSISDGGSTTFGVVQFLNQHPKAVHEFVQVIQPPTKAALLEALTNDHLKYTASEIFSQADADKDGVLSEKEFSQWYNRRFWLGHMSPKQKSLANQPATPPTFNQLVALCIRVGLPFVGFGFMDNLIMLIAGSTIESTFGIFLGLSTLAAAGLGNLVSDVAGIGLGNTIEAAATCLGLPDPKLTKTQQRSSYVRWTRLFASAIGIGLGCLLGMFPLLFIRNDSPLETLFNALDSDSNGKIDLNELQNAINSLHSSVSTSQIHKLFQTMDLDGDGFIDFEEFSLVIDKIKNSQK